MQIQTEVSAYFEEKNPRDFWADKSSATNMNKRYSRTDIALHIFLSCLLPIFFPEINTKIVYTFLNKEILLSVGSYLSYLRRLKKNPVHIDF